jgi:hypothetical protein
VVEGLNKVEGLKDKILKVLDHNRGGNKTDLNRGRSKTDHRNDHHSKVGSHNKAQDQSQLMVEKINNQHINTTSGF